MRNRKKKAIWAGILVILCVAALFIVRSYVLKRLQTGIQQRVEALNRTDINIRYDSIYINWRSNYLRIDALVIEKNAYDTTCIYPEYISAQSVEVKGLSLFSLVFSQKLSFSHLRITRPHFSLRTKSRLLAKSASGADPADFLLEIDQVDLIAANIITTDSATCDVVNESSTSLRLNGLLLESHPNKPLNVNVDLIALDSTTIDLPTAFYRLKFARMQVNFFTKKASLDTLRLLPTLPKTLLGKKYGREVDYIEGVIPFLRLDGFRISYQDTFAIQTNRADIQMFLKIFRDKRLPDDTREKLLPLDQLKKLGWGLSIDTFRIVKSYISYEEFGEEAESAGTIYFDNLKASIYDINNDKELTRGKTVINAQASFMGDGLLEMHTELPWNSEEHAIMRGNLKDFSMKKLNSILMSAANMEVESGDMRNLAFQYRYNASHAEGEIELNYHDLKLTSYKHEEADLKKDGLKSFILNAFVIRKNMDASVPEEKRTGKVSVERNTQRSLFNFWWKAVFAGIKSAYNLDKLQQKAEKKQSKKERRERKREAKD